MEDIYQYIEDHKEMYLDWLMEICRQPSVAAQNRGTEETVNLVEQYLQRLSFAVENIPTSGNPIVYGELNSGKDRTLTFYNHYDVQPEDPIELWESPPFSPEIRDGKLFARGTADNKGTLLSRICAIHAYQQVYKELPINIKFIIEGEEEIGSPHLSEFTEKHPDKLTTDGCIWENGFKSTDGRLQITLGCKGMLYVELHAKGANVDLHSAKAAIVTNPAWRLVWALSTLKNEQEEILIDGFYDRIQEMTIEEKELTESIDYKEKEELEQLGLKSYLNNLTGFNLKEKLIFQPTCTICGMESGYTEQGAKTVLPSVAKAKIDFRLVSEQDPDEILQLLRKHLDKHGFEDIEIVRLKGQRAALTKLNDALVQKVVSSAEKFFEKKPQVMRSQAGTGPMYTLCQKFGIPAVGFGVGHAGSHNHAPNENIYIDDFIEGIKFAALVIHEF
ncbi:M20/M25/M40 family metallo-hydrolase [Bacillus sp. FJAT-49825]|uniref:M20/M25/M40 family metallo-hydrolase n=1 Tax=Neobacillus rhizophilus TaxID=2833579 RepID=A0A942YWD9_9BACI|nr:M20/M25/M40 family metallo-hydrolase [Neobacillus sp. 114]MBS4214872.1 M20/M25/M40 family metallo-hydrolase [Neobacillus rhizophilus]